MESTGPRAEMLGGATRAASADTSATVRMVLLAVGAVLMVVDLAVIFSWVPMEQSIGVLFLIFYFHVPLAWVGFLALAVVFVASIMYLWRGQQRWDALAHSSAEVGVLFISLVLITGSIWAKPANGVWWTWDPRLTTTLILWLIYVGYLMLRAYAPTPSQAARYSAVIGIVGFVDVPIVYFSAVWWRNIIHPVLYVGPVAEGSLDSRMVLALMFSLLTFTVLLVYMLWERLALRNAEDAVREMRYQERMT